MGRTKTAGDQPDDPKEPEWITEAKRDGIEAGREKRLELVREVTALRLAMEQICEIQVLQAQIKFNWFDSLLRAGFSEDNAMGIILHGG